MILIDIKMMDIIPYMWMAVQCRWQPIGIMALDTLDYSTSSLDLGECPSLSMILVTSLPSSHEACTQDWSYCDIFSINQFVLSHSNKNIDFWGGPISCHSL